MVAETGNTIRPPPRLSGDYAQDYPVLVDWIQSLYQTIAVETNVTGTQADLDDRVTALEGSAENIGPTREKVDGIGSLDYLTGTISGTYDPQQLADAYDKINAILQEAKGL
jgi:hypothetical protein